MLMYFALSRLLLALHKVAFESLRQHEATVAEVLEATVLSIFSGMCHLMILAKATLIVL
jgi:hypothetical protein